jgi:hypothetical protein
VRSAIRARGLVALSLIAAACDPAWRYRVKVVDAADLAPVPGAAVQLDCSASRMAPDMPSRRVRRRSDAAGETGFGYVGFGVSTECTIRVEKAGYVTAQYPVAHVCLDRPEQSHGHHRCRWAVLLAQLGRRCSSFETR